MRMKNNNRTEQQVMGSIAVVYAARRFANPFMLKLYALALSAVGIVALVSLSHVGANFIAAGHHGVPAVAIFLFSAVLGTSIMVQIALAVGAGASLSLLADAARSLRPTSRMQGRAA